MTVMRHFFAAAALAAPLLFASWALAQPPAEAAPPDASDEFAGQPTWSPPSLGAVREQVFKLLDDRKADETVRKQAEALWPNDEIKPTTAATTQPNTDKPNADKSDAPDKKPSDATTGINADDSKKADDKDNKKDADKRDDTKKLDDAQKADDDKKEPADKNVTKDTSATPAKPVPATAAPSMGGAELLERVAKTIALVDPPSAALLDTCSKPRGIGPPAKFPWLADDKTPALIRNNMRLWLGRWLAQQQMYDDSLDQIGSLEPTDVVDPASLLFYQAVDHHWLSHKEPGLKSISRLLERKNDVPRRYAQLAILMKSDLSGLKDDSLDHIAREMRDAERRLDLGHAGKKVRKVEDGIIDSLDKLIAKLEEQEKNASGSGGGSSGAPSGIRSTTPASDSAAAKGKGEGHVDPKNIGHQPNWGDLPPKERQEVLQAIGKEFPSHFRDVIEQYFKKAAEGQEP